MGSLTNKEIPAYGGQGYLGQYRYQLQQTDEGPGKDNNHHQDYHQTEGGKGGRGCCLDLEKSSVK